MPPKFKLTYFALQALGEPIRFLLSYGNLDFEDVRVQFDEWPALKPQTPWGQLPLLEVDGKVINQSITIGRYLGTILNLTGQNALENAEIDAIVDTVNDFRLRWVKSKYEQDPVKKEELAKEFEKDSLPYYMERLEKVAKENNGHLALNKLTWADIYVTPILDMVVGPEVLAKYPNLNKVCTKVLTLPSIKAWIDKRPPTVPLPF